MATEEPTLFAPAPQTVTLKKRFPSEYNSWKNARARCYLPSSPSYRYVGARGIGMCERWRHSFANFLNDMGPKPTPDHSVDRKDNAKGYEPDNCRWATDSDQQHNTIKCRWLELNGRLMLVGDWSRETGMCHTTITHRIDYLGWSVERALTTKPRSKKHRTPRKRKVTGPNTVPNVHFQECLRTDLVVTGQFPQDSVRERISQTSQTDAPVAQLDRAMAYEAGPQENQSNPGAS